MRTSANDPSVVRVDRRIGSEELAAPLKRMGVRVELVTLDSADVAWAGNGPEGVAQVGVERKKLSELLTCFGDSRFVGGQLPKLVQRYDVAWLLVEGVWQAGRGGELEMPHRPFGPRITHSYEALTGFLLTLQHKAGVRVVRTASFTDTLWWLHTAYRWWQKPWAKHQSAYALDTVRVPYDPAMTKAPSMVRLLASQLPGIGWAKSEAVAKHFATPRDMMGAGWRTWAKVEGIGEVGARRIVAALRGEG